MVLVIFVYLLVHILQLVVLVPVELASRIGLPSDKCLQYILALRYMPPIYSCPQIKTCPPI